MGKHGKPLTKSKYMTQVRRGHPTAHADGRVRIHRANLYDAIGPGTHLCHWCKQPIEWFGKGRRELVADHVDGNTWNNDPSNLVPACNFCNQNRHSLHSPVCANGHDRHKFTYVDDRGTRICRECHRLGEQRAWKEGRRRETRRSRLSEAKWLALQAEFKSGTYGPADEQPVTKQRRKEARNG